MPGPPQTLPADFAGWDKAPATLPADFNQWDKPAQPKQSFLQRAATQPSQFSHLNPLRYFDEIGQGMAQGVEALAHPIDTASKIWEATKNPVPPGQENKPVPVGELADTLFQGYGQEATGGAVHAAIKTAAPVISDVAQAAGQKAFKAAQMASGVTPKQAAQVAGGVTAGAGTVAAGHPWYSPAAAAVGAERMGRIAELVLGKDRANTPIFARAPEASLPDLTDALARTIADDRARFAEQQARGLGEIPATGAKPAAQTGEALAQQPTPGPEPPKGGKSAAPRFTAQDRAAAQSLLQDALKQSTSAVVDKAISPQNQAANGATKARIEVYLKQGDVAGAEKVLDNAARLTKSNWTPPERQAAPSVNEIRERVQDQAKANKQADQLDDHAIQQQMSYDLQRHGWSAEQEARREFIARNSTGFVKTQNREFGGPSLLSDQLPGEATPKIGKGAKAPAPATDDLTEILQKSLDEARKRRQQK